MIYLDNSSTTIQKPPEVAQIMSQSLDTLGNPARSFHAPALEGARTLLQCRQAIATLTQCPSPMSIAFTSGATESLNLVISSLISNDDHVITTVLEHNSVFRPLYLTGCALSILNCDKNGQLKIDELPTLLTPKTRFLVATHGSNLTGFIPPEEEIYSFCKKNNIIFILDVSQTLGSIPVYANMADILCFTGHKGLMGPQGTGGIICQNPLRFSLVKTGGAGSDTFARHQSLTFPDIFEVGTPNIHGLAGLKASVSFINRVGINVIQDEESDNFALLLSKLTEMKQVILYGSNHPQPQLPILAFRFENYSSDQVAFALWDRYQIATRAGFHCAPLLHKHFQTTDCGLVRLSLGYYTKKSDVIDTVTAISELIKQGV